MNIYSKLLSLTITLLISLAFISDASAQRRYKHVKRVRTPEGISLKPQKTNRSPVNTVPEITVLENKLSIENPEQKMEPEISGTERTSNPGTAELAETPIHNSNPKQKNQAVSRKTILSQNASKALFKANPIYFFRQAGTDADQKSNGSKTGLVLTIVGAVLLVIGILLLALVFSLGELALLLLIFLILLGLVAVLLSIAGLVLLIIGAVKLAASKKNSE